MSLASWNLLVRCLHDVLPQEVTLLKDGSTFGKLDLEKSCTKSKRWERRDRGRNRTRGLLVERVAFDENYRQHTLLPKLEAFFDNFLGPEMQYHPDAT